MRFDLHTKEFYEASVLPDTVFVDSSDLQIGDTVAIYAEGACIAKWNLYIVGFR